MKYKSFFSILSLSIILSGIGVGNYTYAAGDNSVDRLSGSDRYQTSIEVSKKLFLSSKNVIISDGGDYPDSISSTSLSSYLSSPVLLSNKKSDNRNLMNEIKRLKPEKVYIIGGKNSVSKEFEEKLSSLYSVHRVEGRDRYETSANVAKLLKKLGCKCDIVYLVNGYAYQDALSCFNLVNNNLGPIVLVKKDAVDKSISDWDVFKSAKKTIVGGIRSVNIKNMDAKRISGKDKYETNLKVLEKIKESNSLGDKIVVTNGDSFSDSLVAGVLGKKANYSILLNKGDKLLDSTRLFIEKNKIKKISLIGGEKTINKTVKDALLDIVNKHDSNSSIKNKDINIDNMNAYNSILSSKDVPNKYISSHSSKKNTHINSLGYNNSNKDTSKIDKEVSNKDTSKIDKENHNKDSIFSDFKKIDDGSKSYSIYRYTLKNKNDDVISLLNSKYGIDKSDIYILKNDNNTYLVAFNMVKNSKLKEFENKTPQGSLSDTLPSGIYYSHEGNVLSMERNGYDNKVMMVSGDVKPNNIIEVGEVLIGSPLGNSLYCGVNIYPNTKLIEGVSFKAETLAPNMLGSNSIISSGGSTKDLGGSIKIINNTFDFGNESLFAVNGISIYGNKEGTLEISKNKFRGLNKGKEIEISPQGSGIIRVVQTPKENTNVIIRDNDIEKSEYHGISSMDGKSVNLTIENNKLGDIGQNAIFISHFDNSPVVIRGNRVEKYGTRKVLRGSFGTNEKRETNDFENAIVLDYINQVYGVNVNGKWYKDKTNLEDSLKKDNKVTPKEDNNKNKGVLSSNEVSVLRTYSFKNPNEEINTKRGLKKSDINIIKDENKDEVFGLDIKNPTRLIEVNNLRIVGDGSGKITLPPTLKVNGDLIIDAQNATLKNNAKVLGRVIIKNIKGNDLSNFVIEDKKSIKKRGMKTDLDVNISSIVDSNGEAISKEKSSLKELKVSYFKNNKKLDLNRNMYSVDDISDIVKINKDFLNSLDDDTLFEFSLIDLNNNVSNVSKNLVLNIIDNSRANFTVMDRDNMEYIYKHSTKPIRVKISDVVNMGGEKVSKEDTVLKNNVHIKGVLIKEAEGDIAIDDNEDIITINPSFLNKVRSTEFPNSESPGLSSSGEITLTYSDPIHNIGDIDYRFRVRVINKSTLSMELISPMTFIEKNAPEAGISFRFFDVKDATGASLSPEDIDYENINVEAFPFDWKHEVNPQGDIGFRKDLYTIDKKTGILTFKKSYLDLLDVGKEINTEHGMKKYTFTLVDDKHGIDFRSKTFSIYIKKRQQNLDNNTNISVVGDKVLKNETTIKSNTLKLNKKTKVEDLLNSLEGENPRVSIMVYNANNVVDGKVKNKSDYKRYYETLTNGDKLVVYAEDGETYKVYDLVLDASESSDLDSNNPTSYGNTNTGETESNLGKPVYRALMVANYDYPGSRFDLKGPKNDLDLMTKFFKNANFEGNNKFVDVAKIENATKEQFLSKLKTTYKDVKDNDVTYIYYSGHGNNIDNESYICTVDDFGEPTNEVEGKKLAKKAWISVDEFKNALDHIKGVKVIIFDSCNSGGFIGKDAVDAISSPTRVGDVGDRHRSIKIVDSKTSNHVKFAINADKFNKNVTRAFESNSLSIGSKSYLVGQKYKVLTASSGNEYSFEDIKAGYGKFTKELYEAVQEKDGNMKADKNNDRKISLEEVYDYLMNHVLYTSHIQAYPRKDNYTVYELYKENKTENIVDNKTSVDKNNVIQSSTDNENAGNSPANKDTDVDEFYISSKKTGKINNIGISFTKEDGKIIGGSLSSSIVKINTDLTVEKFLSNIEKSNPGQNIYVQKKFPKPNKNFIKKNSDKLSNGDLLLIESANNKLMTMKIKVEGSTNDPTIPNFNGAYRINKFSKAIESGHEKLTSETTIGEFKNHLILPKGYELKYVSSSLKEVNDTDKVQTGDKIAIIPSGNFESRPKFYRIVVEENFDENLDEID